MEREKAKSGARRMVPGDGPSLTACFKLRHCYFVEERQWVPSASLSHPGLETDHYDAHALHLAAVEEEEVVAYLRVLPFQPEVGFMIDRELAAVLGPQERQALPRDGAVELSRLVCRATHPGRATRASAAPMELLLRSLYHLSLECGFSRFYIVVEQAWLRPFARRFGLPFRVLGQPYIFPDGTRTVAAVATLEELEAGMRQHSAAKYAWYRTTLENLG